MSSLEGIEWLCKVPEWVEQGASDIGPSNFSIGSWATHASSVVKMSEGLPNSWSSLFRHTTFILCGTAAHKQHENHKGK